MSIQRFVTQLFRAALFILAKNWKLSKCPLTGERKQNAIFPHVEYYSVIKRNTLPIRDSTWMNLGKHFAK